MKKNKKLLNLTTISFLTLTALSSFSVLAFNQTNSAITNNLQINNEQSNINNSSILISNDTEAKKITNRSYPVIYDVSSANTNEGMIGYDKTNKKLVLTGWDGNVIWEKAFYSSNFNTSNSEIDIHSIIYNENTNHIALLFSKPENSTNNKHSIYFNLVDASQNRSYVFQEKLVVNNINKPKQWKLTKSYDENSYVVFHDEVNKSNFIDYHSEAKNGKTYIIETSIDSFSINKVNAKVNYNNSAKEIFKLLNIRKVNNNRKQYFIANFIVENNSSSKSGSNHSYKYKIVLFDEFFNVLSNSEIAFTSSNDNTEKTKFKSPSTFLIEDSNDGSLKITYAFSFQGTNNKENVILGNIKLNESNKFTDNKYFKIKLGNSYSIEIEKLFFNEQQKMISGIFKNSSKNIVFSFPTSVFNSLSSDENSKRVSDFLQVNGVAKYEQQNSSTSYSQTAAINHKSKVYYTYLDSSNNAYFIKMDYKHNQNNLSLAWNTTFELNSLVWKNANKYSVQYSDEEYKNFLLNSLTDRLENTNITIVSKTNNLNETAILNNTFTQETVVVTYTISNYYSNGNFMSNSSENKTININFLYDQSQTPKIKSLKLNNYASKDNNNFQNVFAKNGTATVYVHADVEAIEEKKLVYSWHKRNLNGRFEKIENQDQKSFTINSFNSDNDGVYKVKVEYNDEKLRTNNNNIIWKEEIFRLNLDTSTIQSIENVTISSQNEKPVFGSNYEINAKTYLKILNTDDQNKIKYEWQFSKDFSVWSKIAQSTQSNTLTIANFAKKDDGYYKVRAYVEDSHKSDFLVSSLESNVIYLTGKSDNDLEISISGLSLQSQSKIGTPIDFGRGNDGSLEISPLAGQRGIFVVNLKDAYNKGVFQWEFGYVDDNNQFVRQNFGDFDSRASEQSSIEVEFDLGQQGKRQYQFKLLKQNNVIAKYDVEIDFKDRLQIPSFVVGNVEVKNDDKTFSNIAISFNSRVQLSLKLNSDLPRTYASYQWFKKDLDSDQEQPVSAKTLNHDDLVISGFSFANEGQYFLKAFTSSDDAKGVVISDKISLIFKQEVVVNEEKRDQIVSPFKIASSILQQDIHEILQQNIDPSKYELLDYQLIANDFEGLLIVIPKVTQKTASSSSVSLNDASIIELSEIVISGFFSFKLLIIILASVIVAAVLIITFVLAFIKSRKYNIPKVEVREQVIKVPQYVFTTKALTQGASVPAKANVKNPNINANQRNVSMPNRPPVVNNVNKVAKPPISPVAPQPKMAEKPKNNLPFIKKPADK